MFFLNPAWGGGCVKTDVAHYDAHANVGIIDHITESH